VSAASKYKVIYNFSGGSHGSGPNLFDALAIDARGNLYGAAAGGTGTGCDGPCGVVFKMTPAANGKWRENVLFDFSVKNGEPNTSLPLDRQGNLYGGAIGGKLGYGDLLYQLTLGTGQRNFDVVEDPGISIGLIADAQGKNLYGFFGDWILELSHGADGWAQTVLYKLCPKGNDCKNGIAPLVPELGCQGQPVRHQVRWRVQLSPLL
jgi:hypothetical protein